MSDMSDKSGKADQPTVIGLELCPATLRQIAELLPPIAAWAKAEGSEEPLGPGDVIALAVHRLHHDVYSRAHDMLAEAGEEAPTVQ